MKQIVVLFIALFSLAFLTGGSCDSGDFTTSYFFCCDPTDPTGTSCVTNSSQCQTNWCSTGQQSFLNGQNECATLQTDASNNNCGLTARFNWYLTIGCTGIFTEFPPFVAPTLLTATQGAPTTVTLTWANPTGFENANLVYYVSRGVASLTEGLIAPGIVGNTYIDTGLVSGATYFYVVSASLVSSTGVAASPGTNSNELSVIAP